MPPALLDTNAVSDLMKNQVKLSSRMKAHPAEVLTTITVVGEIQFGIERMPPGKKRSDLEVRAQLAFTQVSVEPVDLSVSYEYGSLKAKMEKNGVTMQDNDIWIAAAAIVRGCILITRDADFSQIPGLLVEDWTV